MTKVRKAVITAAGRGTRHFPASRTVQKELFPLLSAGGFTRPALQLIAMECLASGIDEICIVGNPANLPAIKAHFAPPSDEERRSLAGKEWTLKLIDELARIAERLHFVEQKTPEGFGHAVYQAKNWAAAEPVLVLLGDHVYLAPKTHCVRQVADVWDAHQAPVSSVEPLLEREVIRTGIVVGKSMDERLYKVRRIVEKPSVEEARRELATPGLPSGYYLSHFGIHAFPSTIFDALHHLIEKRKTGGDEVQLTSAQNILVLDSPLYLACRIDGCRLDMGQPNVYAEAMAAMAVAVEMEEDAERGIELRQT